MFSSEPILVHQVQERVRLQSFGHDPSLLMIINIGSLESYTNISYFLKPADTDTYIGISASLHKVNCVLPPLIAYFINIFHY